MVSLSNHDGGPALARLVVHAVFRAASAASPRQRSWGIAEM